MSESGSKVTAGSQRAKPKRDVVKSALAGLIVVAALFLAFAPESVWQGGGVSPASERKAGDDITLPDINGGRWSLAEQRGRVVLVNYWATWCPPCRAETPGLVRLANEYTAKGLEVVGISLDEDLTAVREFMAEYRISYPILLPSGTSNLTMMIESIPVTLLYDRRGRVAKRYVGAVSETTLRRDVEQLLAEQ